MRSLILLLLVIAAMALPEPLPIFATDVTAGSGVQGGLLGGQGGLLAGLLGGGGGLLQSLLGGDGLVGGLVSGLLGRILGGGGLLGGLLGGGGRGGLLGGDLGGVSQVSDVVSCILGQLLGQVGGLNQILGPPLGALGLNGNLAGNPTTQQPEAPTTGTPVTEDYLDYSPDALILLESLLQEFFRGTDSQGYKLLNQIFSRQFNLSYWARLLADGVMDEEFLTNLVIEGGISAETSASIQRLAADLASSAGGQSG